MVGRLAGALWLGVQAAVVVLAAMLIGYVAAVLVAWATWAVVVVWQTSELGKAGLFLAVVAFVLYFIGGLLEGQNA